MIKSRTLDVDLGDRSDGKYYASSGVGPTSTVKGCCYINCFCVQPDVAFCPGTEDCLLTSYYLPARDKANSLPVLPVGVGHERIESTTKARPHFNNCVHTRVQGHNYPYLIAVVNPLQPSRIFYSDYWRKQTTGSLVGLGTLNPLPWSVFDGAQRRAWWSMQPRFETEISMLNFIYELKDFKSMAKYLLKFRFADVGLRMLRLKQKLIRMSKETSALVAAGKTLQQITRTAAEARLIEQYAIKPTIKDLTSILSTLASTITAVQEQFAQRGQSSQLSHYTEKEPQILSGHYGSNNDSMFYYGYSSESAFTATLRYKYSYKFRKGWDLIEKAMGLQFNAEVLWNMIPFSFLVDYFYSVGRALHAMRTDPNVQLEPMEYCESILQYKTYGTSIDTLSSKLRAFESPSARLTETPFAFTPIAGYTATHYRRRLTLPNKGTGLPRIHRPKDGQWLNMAALFRCFFD